MFAECIFSGQVERENTATWSTPCSVVIVKDSTTANNSNTPCTHYLLRNANNLQTRTSPYCKHNL